MKAKKPKKVTKPKKITIKPIKKYWLRYRTVGTSAIRNMKFDSQIQRDCYIHWLKTAGGSNQYEIIKTWEE